MLLSRLPEALSVQVFHWGHDEGSGVFTNTTIIYRDLFPKSALVDKGLLQVLLREVVTTMVPVTSNSKTMIRHESSADTDKVSIGDFGALDGQYSAWLNDTGVFEAFAVEGSPNVADLTDGKVNYGDLTKDLSAQLPGWLIEGKTAKTGGFDLVLCIEVAEHIPLDKQKEFLANLDRFARGGLVISWAPPHILGEGHVATMEFEDSRKLIEQTMVGMKLEREVTAKLRAKSDIAWIRETIAFYRRDEEFLDSPLRTQITAFPRQREEL